MASLLLHHHAACAAPSELAPRTDVLESEQGYTLQLDLPGISKSELNVQVENDTITIKGDRKLSGTPEGYHRVERPFGSFSRTFLLPEFVNSAAIEAKLSDGVLNLFLPRREEAKPRQVQVAVN